MATVVQQPTNGASQQPAKRPLIPHETSPMTKFIRTGEGILVFAFNIALLVVPIVSNALSATEAAKWAGILDAVAVVARTGLKMVSESKSVTGIAPPAVDQELVAKVAAAVAPLVTQAAKDTAHQQPLSAEQLAAQVAANATDIENIVADVEEFANAPNASGSESAQGAMLGVTPGTSDSSIGGSVSAKQGAPADAAVSDAEEFASTPSPDESGDAQLLGVGGAVNGQTGMPTNTYLAGE